MSLFSLLFGHKGFRATHVQIVSISLTEMKQEISQICHTMILLKVIRPKENSCAVVVVVVLLVYYRHQKKAVVGSFFIFCCCCDCLASQLLL
jgi:hypothetical protein